MKTPNSSPAYTGRQRRPADNGDSANPFTLSDRLHTKENRTMTAHEKQAAARQEYARLNKALIANGETMTSDEYVGTVQRMIEAKNQISRLQVAVNKESFAGRKSFSRK